MICIKVYNFADDAQLEHNVLSSTLQYHNYFLKLVNVMETFVVHIKNCIPIYYFFMHHMLDIIGLSLEPFSTNLLKIFQLQNCSCYALNLQKQNNLVQIFLSFLKCFFNFSIAFWNKFQRRYCDFSRKYFKRFVDDTIDFTKYELF